MRALKALCLWLALSLPGLAQDQATLVADSLVMQDGALVASGTVEVFFKGSRITASRITYDTAADRLAIEGPIVIEDATGNKVTADSADLSADLTEGLIRTARIVIGEKLQLAAGQMRRAPGVTAMRAVAASSCRVCGNGPPLWEIRAREVIQDATTRQIWFSGATLRFVGLPVVYLPVLRVPDPSVRRANGFLMPRLRSSTVLGNGISLPYFITIGPSRDVTLTPFLTDNGGRTLNWRYRQAFRSGTLDVAGAFSRDELITDKMRFYLRARAVFDLGSDWHLGLDGTVLSDAAYLQDYGISEDDRLVSSLRLTRVRRDSYTSAELTSLRTLRTTESNATQPSALIAAQTRWRFVPGALGGIATLYGDTATQRRVSGSGADADADGIADGRDMGRISLGVTWTRRWVGAQGLVLEGGLQGGVDLYDIAQDDIYQGEAARSLMRGGLRLSWPLIRTDGRGTTLVEPAVQLVGAASHATGPIPNEDSRLVEFDEANLYALDRFSGADAIETGARLNLGVTVTRQAGWGGYGLTLGRVLRAEDPGLFTQASGLSGLASDWLLAGQVTTAVRGGTLAMTGRAMMRDDLSLSRFESQFALVMDRRSISGGYEFVQADAAQGRTQDVRELVLTGTAKLAQSWSLAASNRYDLSTRTTRASFGLGFRNECLAIDLSVSRRFTSSSIVEPSSDVGLTVELLGLGGASEGQTATTCRR